MLFLKAALPDGINSIPQWEETTATSTAGFCSETIQVFNVIGHVVMILKVLVPLIIIVLGIIDLSKAVISNDDKAISKSAGSLVKRFIAGVVIFFIPTIVTVIFDMLELVNVKGDFNTCLTCITDVGNCGKTTSNNKS